jgi:hypothetical protein
MLKILFRNGKKVEYPDIVISAKEMSKQLRKEFICAETNVNSTFYRTSEIVEIEITKME